MSLSDNIKNASGRIVNVASIAAKYAKFTDVNNLDQYAGRVQAYPITKLCNVLYTIELASRLKGADVTTYSVHPGYVISSFFRDLPSFLKWFMEKFLGQLAKVSIAYYISFIIIFIYVFASLFTTPPVTVKEWIKYLWNYQCWSQV